MALQLGDIMRFYHIPRTGGNYIRQVLAAIGTPISEVGHPHHSPLDMTDNTASMTFCVWRDPVGWYASYWGYRQSTGWRDHPIDRNCRSPHFAQFVRHMRSTYPLGYYTGLVCRYLPYVDRVLRFNRLADELADIIRDCGMEPPECIASRVNDSRVVPDVTEEVANLIRRMEAGAYRAFNHA